MKYKVGDRVRVKTLGEFSSLVGRNIEHRDKFSYPDRDGCFFVDEMFNLCGKYVTIYRVNSGHYCVEGSGWSWMEWMFSDEPIVNVDVKSITDTAKWRLA